MTGLDPSLYLITDRTLTQSMGLRRCVELAVSGGVTAVQLREKALSSKEFLSVARELHLFLLEKGIPLIINDRIDIALAIGAEGVHLGQNDMPISEARRLLKQKAIIGITAENLDQAQIALEQEIDYLAVSYVFPSQTKAHTSPPWGLAGIRKVKSIAGACPVIGIGGISLQNVISVLEAGADGIAVVSAICGTPDPSASAKSLKSTIDKFRGMRKIWLGHDH